MVALTWSELLFVVVGVGLELAMLLLLFLLLVPALVELVDWLRWSL